MIQTTSLASASLSLRGRLTAALLAALAGAACGTTEGDDGLDPEPEPEPTDTTAPLISGSVPATGASGVAADQAVVITFSEPMDPATVEAAYASADLPAGQVDFAWNAALTVLTITPTTPLEYAAGIGTDPEALEARAYALTIGTAATDFAGNPLAAPFELAFATKRRLLAQFPIHADMTRVLRDTTLLSVANPIWIGDSSTGQVYRSYLTFDLASLPASAEVEIAEIVARQTAPSGAPYGLGAVMAYHVTYPAMIDANTASPLSTAGALSTDPILETKRLAVTAQVQDDVVHRAERSDRSQFRLATEVPTTANGDTDVAVFAKDSVLMNIRYVAD